MISGTAAAASGTLTVTRTISDPAAASAATWVDRAGDVGRVGAGHRLHDHGRAAAHLDVTDLDANRAMQTCDVHGSSCERLAAPFVDRREQRSRWRAD